MRYFPRSVVVLALAVSIAMVGCPCNSVINGSESIRWFLFSNFGASKICPEVLKRGVPLKFAALGASNVGRFFPGQCQAVVNDPTHTMALTLSGTGYVVLPVTRRVGFYAQISVEYRPDFRLEDDALYVWGKFSRMLALPDLRLLGVENPVVSLATHTPIGDLAATLGQGIMTSEVARGFTVVRTDKGDAFALGEILPPARPKRPFEAGEDHALLESDTSELRATSRDYLGPFYVQKSDAALFLRFRVAGAQAEYLVVDKASGDLWRQGYERAMPMGPPPGPPLAFGSAQTGETKKTLAVSPGGYYVVIENRAPAPLTQLGIPLLAEPVSYVSYGVEVGERP